jgi:hypothetical protein
MIASTASALRETENTIFAIVWPTRHLTLNTKERGRLEGQLREVRDEREQCRDR